MGTTHLPRLGLTLGLALLSVACGGGSHSAPPPDVPLLVSFNPVDVDPDPHYFVGYEFTVETAITVDALGAYDDAADGLAAAHMVALYDAGHVLIDSVTVTTADPATGDFRYHSLGAPLLLAPGTYFLSGEVVGGDPYVFQADAIVFDPRVTYVDSFYSDTEAPDGVLTATSGFRQYMNVSLLARP